MLSACQYKLTLSTRLCRTVLTTPRQINTRAPTGPSLTCLPSSDFDLSETHPTPIHHEAFAHHLSHPSNLCRARGSQEAQDQGLSTRLLFLRTRAEQDEYAASQD
jgi:hypothetical protein